MSISATRRPRQRAYLMHIFWLIAKNQIDPADARPFKPNKAEDGVDIQWVHTRPNGTPDRAARRAAAREMVDGFATGGDLIAVARTYGVIHFSPPAQDPPHWSLTGG